MIKDLLHGFRGFLHCDGYEVYSNLPNVLSARCFAHVRRKFFEACNSHGQSQGLAHQAMVYIDQLFRWEREWQASHLSPPELLERRQTIALPLWQEFLKWIQSHHFLQQSKLGKAVAYTLKYAEDLSRVFYHPELSLDNNLAERSIRPIAIGRKNWLFSTSLEGAESNAMIYSLIETAKANGLNPQRYITYLLTHLPNEPALKTGNLEAYLPWSPIIQAQCHE